MNKQLVKTTYHPVYQILLLIVFCILAGVFGLILGIIGFGVFNGIEDLLVILKQGVSFSNSNINLLRTIQISSTFGAFILGPLSFAKVAHYNLKEDLRLAKPFKVIWILLTLALVTFFSPFIDHLGELNKMMHLPESLRELELWMQEKENQAAEATKILLQMKNYQDLLINIFMIAILPAIGEELLFRGILQPLFTKMFKHIHVAIFISAILFSAMHMQFYGFLPRLFLGALFGYLFYWSNNLWVPILAHFINNLVAVIAAYQFQLQGKSLDELISSSQHYSLPIVMFSLAGGAAMLYLFYRFRYKENYYGE